MKSKLFCNLIQLKFIPKYIRSKHIDFLYDLGSASVNCTELRETKECLDLTCRMGCEYGFILSEETGCPTCQCRDPCGGVACADDEQCQLVEVSCKDHYCPPVPACKWEIVIVVIFDNTRVLSKPVNK